MELDLVAALNATRPAAGPAALPAGQRARHAAILAAARVLFGAQGPKHVTIRRLAAHSGVTAPTIYHLVGNRDEVLAAALLEQLQTCIALVPLVAARHDINPIAAFADILFLSTQHHPSYARHQMELNWKTLEGRRLSKSFTDHTIQALTGWVKELCARSRLAKRLGHATIAAAIEAQLRASMLDWANGTDSLAALRRKLARGASISLLRFADEKVTAKIMAWLDHLDAAP